MRGRGGRGTVTVRGRGGRGTVTVRGRGGNECEWREGGSCHCGGEGVYGWREGERGAVTVGEGGRERDCHCEGEGRE